MRAVFKRVSAGGWWAALWAGAFFFVFVGRLEESHPIGQMAIFGALYALAVHGLMHVFGVRRWGWVVAGFLCGPLPASILWEPRPDQSEERAGGLLVSLIFGVLLGLLQWAREARAVGAAACPDPTTARPGE
jgi:hypothetical protein